MAIHTQLWLVGHFISDTEGDDIVWRYCGIFKTEEQAVDVALSISPDCFVAEVNVGCMEAANPDMQCDWNTYYPEHEEENTCQK